MTTMVLVFISIMYLSTSLAVVAVHPLYNLVRKQETIPERSPASDGTPGLVGFRRRRTAGADLIHPPDMHAGSSYAMGGDYNALVQSGAVDGEASLSPEGYSSGMTERTEEDLVEDLAGRREKIKESCPRMWRDEYEEFFDGSQQQYEIIKKRLGIAEDVLRHIDDLNRDLKQARKDLNEKYGVNIGEGLGEYNTEDVCAVDEFKIGRYSVGGDTCAQRLPDRSNLLFWTEYYLSYIRMGDFTDKKLRGLIGPLNIFGTYGSSLRGYDADSILNRSSKLIEIMLDIVDNGGYKPEDHEMKYVGWLFEDVDARKLEKARVRMERVRVERVEELAKVLDEIKEMKKMLEEKVLQRYIEVVEGLAEEFKRVNYKREELEELLQKHSGAREELEIAKKMFYEDGVGKALQKCTEAIEEVVYENMVEQALQEYAKAVVETEEVYKNRTKEALGKCVEVIKQVEKMYEIEGVRKANGFINDFRNSSANTKLAMQDFRRDIEDRYNEAKKMVPSRYLDCYPNKPFNMLFISYLRMCIEYDPENEWGYGLPRRVEMLEEEFEQFKTNTPSDLVGS
jgi:hypothetical protein